MRRPVPPQPQHPKRSTGIVNDGVNCHPWRIDAMKRQCSRRATATAEAVTRSSAPIRATVRATDRRSNTCLSRELDPSDPSYFGPYRIHSKSLASTDTVPSLGDACAGGIATHCRRVECACRGTGTAVGRSEWSLRAGQGTEAGNGAHRPSAAPRRDRGRRFRLITPGALKSGEASSPV